MSLLDQIAQSFTGSAYQNLDPRDTKVAQNNALMILGQMLSSAAGAGSWTQAHKFISGAMPAAVKEYQTDLEAARKVGLEEEEAEYQRGARGRRAKLDELQLEEATERSEQAEALRSAAEDRAVLSMQTAESAVAEAVKNGRMSPENGENYLKRIGMYLDLAKKAPDKEEMWNKADDFLVSVMSKAGAMDEFLSAQRDKEKFEAEMAGMTVEELRAYKKEGLDIGRAIDRYKKRIAGNEATQSDTVTSALTDPSNQGQEFPEKDGMILVPDANGKPRWIKKPNPQKDQELEESVKAMTDLSKNDSLFREIEAYAGGSEDIDKLSFTMRRIPIFSAFGIMPSGREGQRQFYTREDAQKVLQLITNPALARRHLMRILSGEQGGTEEKPSGNQPEMTERQKNNIKNFRKNNPQIKSDEEAIRILKEKNLW